MRAPRRSPPPRHARRGAWHPSSLGETLGDPLLRNSFFLMSLSALGAGAGFVFWMIVARIYPAAEVGRASSLLSCLVMLSYFSLFGFGNALIRGLPTSGSPDEDTSTAVTAVGSCAVVVAGAFLVVGPSVASELRFVGSSALHALVFVALAVGAAVNLLTDSVFVALRATRTNFVINGILMNVVKLTAPVLLVAAGAFGIFAASGVASAVAAAVSVAVLRRTLRLRVRLSISPLALRSMLGYSLANYASGNLNLVPQITLPIIVLQQLGPVPSSVYFIAFQIANVVNSISYSVGEALFAEGSHESERLWRLARRSAGLILAVTAPAALAVMASAKIILGLFGEEYVSRGTGALVVFTASSFAVAFKTWASFLLKVTRQLPAMVAADVVLVGVILGLVSCTSRGGLHWVALAWGAGNLASGVVAVAALGSGARPPMPSRAATAPSHRKV